MKPQPTDDFLSAALLCAAAHELPATAGPVVMFMPGGMQTITPFAGGIGSPIEVMVDASGAGALNQQLTSLAAKGRKPYFDFEHEDAGASFWPAEFFWSETPKPGIYARGEWTADGQAGVEGKRWRQFSPVFHVDNKAARPARIVCNPSAKPNMGGLVNDPAFSNILPLWAKNATGAHSGNHTNTYMDPEQLKALQDKIKELETEIATLKGKGQTDEVSAARVECKEAQLKLAQAELENSELKAKNAKADTEIQAGRAAAADAAVNDAIARGAIAAKDDATIKAWRDDIIADPARAALLAKMGGNQAVGAPRVTSSAPSGVAVTQDSPNNVIKAFGAVVAKNAALPLSAATAADKARLANEAAAIFAKDISGNPIITGMSLDDAIKAADYSDAAGGAGLLSGSLVMQKALATMGYEYPILNQVTTDFSGEPGELNQTANTRIVLTPAVQTYVTTLGSDGRPAGWSTASAAQAVDVPVTIDSYYGVPIVFGIGTIASTVRDLFGETAPLAMYALGGAIVSKLTALMTAANFNAYAGTSLAGGVTTSGSKTIAFDSSAAVYPGQHISGTGIPTNTFIASVTSATAAVMTQKATASGTGLTFTVGNSKVPTTYTTYAKALADFNSACYADLKAAFSTNEVPQNDRFCLLSSTYYGKLSQDPIFNMFAAMKSPELVTKGALPEVQGFKSIEAPYFPAASYGVGFAGHKAALVLKTRLPQQLSQSFAAAAPGNISTVTDPGTGISMSLVQFWNLQTNAYEWRPEIMVGAAAGDRRCGLLLTSQ
jgi:hypothetical protein